jgi:asparagine synthase (glutamine-hydrolysing)
MCGIAGVVRFDGGRVQPGQLQAMAGALAHRGPDGTGYWQSGPVGLAHRRLSIIDPTGSAQPMTSADGSLVACFNGEVLNYRQLRDETAGYGYRTDGDTEVLLAMHTAHGADGARRLRGQFAYALHDTREGSVWLARDPLGILPLYYLATAEALYFSSEIKAVLAALPSPPPVDDDSLDAYLSARAVAAPFTLLSGVRKVLPGHVLHVRPDRSLEERPYWSLPDEPYLDDLDDEAAVAMVREALDVAVQRNLVADVPVGAYLSGGLDSSLLVALMTRARTDVVDTFSAGFGDARLDEVTWARRVSEHLGTRHHEVTVRPEDFVEHWPRLTWHRDAPLSEPADLAVNRLAATAREHVKVVLSGEGSDELFGGYPKHRFAGVGAALDRVPGRVHQRVLQSVETRLPARLDRLRTAARALSADGEEARLQTWFAPFTARDRARLLGGPPARALTPAATGKDPLDRQLRHDLRAWLPDNLLERGDRMSMAASLEMRPAFLDLGVVDVAMRLPNRFKVRRGSGKWVVKQVARDLLPAAVVDRPKSGFRVPLSSWFRGSLRDMVHDRLTGPDSFVGGRMDRAALRELLDRHAEGRSDEAIRLWTLLSLEIWHDVTYRRSSAGGGLTSVEGAGDAEQEAEALGCARTHRPGEGAGPAGTSPVENSRLP